MTTRTKPRKALAPEASDSAEPLCDVRADEPAEKHSVTMPAAVSKQLRDRVGPRGISAYVSAAVARQLRRDALAEAIERTEAKHGPADPDDVAEWGKKLGW